MIEISQQIFEIGATLLGVVLVAQIGVAIYLAGALRIASKQRNELSKEMFGLVKKLEGLTATRREEVLRHYDKMLETLSNRLPPTIAAEASQTILETESKILSRLAELEAEVGNDEESKERINELIRSMESLERTIVGLTAETVRQVMAEGRRDLLDNDQLRFTQNLAA